VFHPKRSAKAFFGARIRIARLQRQDVSPGSSAKQWQSERRSERKSQANKRAAENRIRKSYNTPEEPAAPRAYAPHRRRPQAHTANSWTEQQDGALSNLPTRHVGHPRTRPPVQYRFAHRRPMIAELLSSGDVRPLTERGGSEECERPNRFETYRPERQWFVPPASPTRIRSNGKSSIPKTNCRSRGSSSAPSFRRRYSPKAFRQKQITDYVARWPVRDPRVVVPVTSSPRARRNRALR